MTGSTTALLYQLRSKKAISPGFGKLLTYRWKYHWPFSTSVGLGKATTFNDLGFKYSINRRMAPPFPAASLPSKIMATRRPESCTSRCNFTNSICKSLSSDSYWRTFMAFLASIFLDFNNWTRPRLEVSPTKSSFVKLSFRSVPCTDRSFRTLAIVVPSC